MPPDKHVSPLFTRANAGLARHSVQFFICSLKTQTILGGHSKSIAYVPFAFYLYPSVLRTRDPFKDCLLVPVVLLIAGGMGGLLEHNRPLPFPKTFYVHLDSSQSSL